MPTAKKPTAKKPEKEYPDQPEIYIGSVDGGGIGCIVTGLPSITFKTSERNITISLTDESDVARLRGAITYLLGMIGVTYKTDETVNPDPPEE